MPSARRGRAPVHRSTVAVLALLWVLAVAVESVGRASQAHAGVAAPALRWITLASLVLIVVMAVAALLGVASLRGRGEALEMAAPEEEPYLPAPRAPRLRGRSLLVTFLDLEPGAGASSLAFNLAVLVAMEGRPVEQEGELRQPRSLCLLSQGQITRALDLAPEPMAHHLDRNSGRVVEDLIDLAWRHPTGCEMLCLPPGRVGRHQLRLLRHALDRHYDLVVVDCNVLDSTLREGVEDTSDALLAAALPSSRSHDAATRLLETRLRGSRLATTVLVLNQVRADDREMEELTAGFGYAAFFPYEHLIPEADRRGLPWALAPEPACGRVLRQLAHRLLPELLQEEGAHLLPA